MALKSLFDKGRRREIRDGIRSGRLDLRRKRIGEPEAEPGISVPLNDDDKITPVQPAHMTEAEVRERMAQLNREIDAQVPQPTLAPDEPITRRHVRKLKSDFDYGFGSIMGQMLVSAILARNVRRVSEVHRLGADLNVDTSSFNHKDTSGRLCRTPLQIAVSLGQTDVIQYLKKNGAR